MDTTQKKSRKFIMKISELLEQEDKLQFIYFNNQTAWDLGIEIKKIGEQQKAPIIIEIFAYGHVLFCYSLPGAAVDNFDWMKRKRNAVLRYGHSSLFIGESNRQNGRPYEELEHIDHKRYCAHGGSFPVRIKKSGLVGAVTISGLPQLEDHGILITALTKYIEENMK